LDEVYDVRLRELPEELDEALKLADKAKVEIINDLYADQIVALEMQIAENSHFEEASKVDQLYLKRIKAQRLIVEKYLNACLFERV
jgi:hypothetical protein